MATIYYDAKSGNLVQGIVWELLPDDRGAFDHTFVYGNDLSETDWTYQCPSNKKHQTGASSEEILLEIFGGPSVTDWVRIADRGGIVTQDFADRVQACKLTGMSFRNCVKVDCNQSKIETPKFLLAEVPGKGGRCQRFKVSGGPNICPFCGLEPVVCPDCRVVFNWCPNCDQRILRDEGDVKLGDIRLVHRGFPNSLIVEAKDWDGSNFFAVKGTGGSWFVDRKAKDWLEKTHVTGSKLRPALLNIEGVEDKFKSY